MRALFKWLLLCVAIAFVVLPAGTQAQPLPPDSFRIERGIEKFVHLDGGILRLSIGDTKIVDVSILDGTTLRLLGISSGETTFSVWRAGSSAPKTYSVVVMGNLAALRERLVASGNDTTVRLSEIGGKIVIEGRFNDTVAQSEARQLAQFISGKDVLDLSDVAMRESVQVEVEVVTVSRTALNELGLNFSRLDKDFSIVSTVPNALRSFALNANGRTGLEATLTTPIANAFNLLVGSPKYNALVMISALESNNFARTLARPTLVVRSGEKANFLVGGEIPIPVPQGGTTNTVTIQYKRFGISLNVEPTILKDRHIALKIKPEVSELDFTNAIAIQGFSIPAIRTRETETTVEVAADEPLILAGLMFDSGNTIKEQVPFLSSIPILGEFFKRASETHEEQELIISVTPRLVTSATQNRSQWESIEKQTEHAPLPGPQPAPQRSNTPETNP